MNGKIILGTVQLGLPYGINNRTGKPSDVQAFKILDCAWDNNISTLDSADNYGEALAVIGRYSAIKQRTFKLINKFKLDETPLAVKLANSLNLTHSKCLYCYMYHQFSDYKTSSAKHELLKLKEKQLIKKIGVSIYSTKELEDVLDDDDIEIIQLPVNILDLSAEKQSLIQDAKRLGKEIHARSIFLQGLFFKDPAALPGNLKALAPYLHEIAAVSRERGISLKQAALNFVVSNPLIDFAVLGVETVSQLMDNLSIIEPTLKVHEFRDLSIKTEDAYLLNPANWRI